MSAGTSEFFCLICFFVCSCSAQTIITADLGQEVILPCKAPKSNIFIFLTPVKWIRPGLEPEHVFLHPGEGFYSKYQHPSYQNRVDLQDKEMKDGNFSLILKNVMKNDTGRYECRVYQRETNQKTWSWKIESIINLEVLLSGDEDGGDEDGGDKDGGDEDGGDEDGGNKDGGDEDGGDEDGGDEDGGDKDGGDEDGGNKDGGDEDGGDEDGGDEDGGDEDGGNKDGGDEDGRNKDGGDKDGGNKDGGNKDGGNKDGGDEDGNIVRSVLAVILVALSSVGVLICRSLDDP